MYEIMLRCNYRLMDRIKTLAKEYGVSINKMLVYLLELGVYRVFEEESEYGKINFKYQKKKEDNDEI